MEDGGKEQGGGISHGGVDGREIQQRSVILFLWFQSHYPKIYSLLFPSYRCQDSMVQNVPWMSKNPMTQQVLWVLELDPGMIKWMISNPNVMSLMMGRLEHGKSWNKGVDLFVSRQQEVRAQMEAARAADSMWEGACRGRGPAIVATVVLGQPRGKTTQAHHP